MNVVDPLDPRLQVPPQEQTRKLMQLWAQVAQDAMANPAIVLDACVNLSSAIAIQHGLKAEALTKAIESVFAVNDPQNKSKIVVVNG